MFRKCRRRQYNSCSSTYEIMFSPTWSYLSWWYVGDLPTRARRFFWQNRLLSPMFDKRSPFCQINLRLSFSGSLNMSWFFRNDTKKYCENRLVFFRENILLYWYSHSTDPDHSLLTRRRYRQAPCPSLKIQPCLPPTQAPAFACSST